MPESIHPLRLIATIAVLAVSSPTAQSADTESWPDIIARADAAMASIKTMQGRFVQVSPSGDISRGSYYMRRPGRVRFEYDAPSGLLVVADGTTVAVSDSKLKSFDRFLLSSTVLGIFLDDQAQLSEQGRILNVRSGQDRYYIRVGDRNGELDQRMILEFAEQDFALLGWSIVDGTGQQTRIALRDNIIDKPLSARLFQIHDPNEKKDRRR